MRLLLRFGFLAAFAGLLVGLALRVALTRRRFVALAAIALAPLVAHAGYLVGLASRAGLPGTRVLVFVAGALLIVVSAAIGAGPLTRKRPWFAVVMPLLATLAYAVLEAVTLGPAWGPKEYAPDALAGAAYVLASVFFAALLVPFAPAARAPSKPTGERRQP